MAISNFTLNRIYNDYKNELIGVKISKIVKISNYDFAFILFSNKQKSIIFSLTPLHPYFFVSSSFFKTLNETNPFISNLKKYFENGTITNIEKVKNDRILIFEIKKITPTYQTINYKLVVELIPHRTNAIILDQDDIIISALKMSSSLLESKLIARGVKYNILENEDKTINYDDSLISLKNKISTTLYKDIVYRVEKENESLSKIISEILSSNKYYLYHNDIISIPLHSLPSKEIELDKIADIYKQMEDEKYKKEHFNLVFNLVNHKLKGLRNKLVNLEKEYQKNLSKKDYVNLGNLLYQAQDQYHKGLKSIKVMDIEIALDENLNLSENAQKYFKQYQKSKIALINIEKQQEITKDKIEFFEKIESQIKFASLDDMNQIIQELKDTGYIKEDQKKKKKNQNLVYPPHFITIDGYKIGYGLTSYQNDYLTFSLAKKDDYFLHVKDHHGPHVVIFSSSPSKEAILFASEISLYFAKLDAGEVYLCDQKDVKKVPGKIGLVTLNKYTTINIKEIRESTKQALERI